MEGMGLNPIFWANRKVLVTGHTGFKGSWLCLWLQQLGAQVTGYALAPSTSPNLFNSANVSAGMRSKIGDIRDLDALRKVVTEERPEIVIHMAAQALVRLSYDDPVGTYATNVMGTAHLLQTIRECDSIRAVVNVTSDKCYENREWVWGYRETDPMGGYDPYSNSKGCAELVTDAYRNSFFHPAKYGIHRVAIGSGRAGNVIGGGDWASDRLIPDMMRAISMGKAAEIRNPNAIRPWQHVLEPLAGYMALAEKLVTSGPDFIGAWNFGPDDSDTKPVKWIVERLVECWGEGANWCSNDAPQPHEANYLRLDCSKARALLGWKPQWNLSEAIDRIVEWHKAFELGADMQALTHSQINSYQNT